MGKNVGDERESNPRPQLWRLRCYHYTTVPHEYIRFSTPFYLCIILWLCSYSTSFEKKKAYLLKKQQHELDSLELKFRREKSEATQQRNREAEQVTLRYGNLKSSAQNHHSQFESKACLPNQC